MQSYAIQLIGGPLDGETIVIPDPTYRYGIYTAMTPDPPHNQTRYYQHGHHPNIWLHETVTYQATHGTPQE